MCTSPADNPASQDQPPARRRRPRYRGTHPRRFEERYKELDPAAHPEMQEHVRAQGRTPAGTHVPVMVAEVLQALRPVPGDVVADCTVGHGGHAREFLRHILPGGRLIGLDLDAAELARAAQFLAAVAGVGEVDSADRDVAGEEPSRPAVSLHHCNFAGLGKVLAREGLTAFDVVFADLGVSSMQIDAGDRGFSYKYDGPLDMRMNQRTRETAADLLQSLTVEELSRALADLADEPYNVRIARQIVARRTSTPLTRTSQLVDVVLEARGLTRRAWKERRAAGSTELHPAARTFQALRILVNNELRVLEQLLRIVPHCLAAGGRVGILTFHSGEERRVRQALEEGRAAGVYADIGPASIRPAPTETAANPRSRSARLHWAVRAAAAVNAAGSWSGHPEPG